MEKDAQQANDLTPEELAAQEGEPLPDREAMSVLVPPTDPSRFADLGVLPDDSNTMEGSGPGPQPA